MHAIRRLTVCRLVDLTHQIRIQMECDVTVLQMTVSTTLRLLCRITLARTSPTSVNLLDHLPRQFVAVSYSCSIDRGCFSHPSCKFNTNTTNRRDNHAVFVVGYTGTGTVQLMLLCSTPPSRHVLRLLRDFHPRVFGIDRFR